MKDIMILPCEINPSWNDFLNEERLNELRKIEVQIGHHYNPRTENVLRFMNNDLDKLEIVILGQDPYPEEGRAVGRAFEVGDLKSWEDKFRQVSLKNIVRLLHKTYNNIESYGNIKKFSEIQKEIEIGSFKILPPDQLFESWEKQGVLLLNAYLTCEIGKPGSHRELWRPFTEELIQYIDNKSPDLKWFLWGKDAISFKKYILKGKIYSSRHPMMCSERYEDDFLKSHCFKETQNEINWLGTKRYL